MNTLLLLFSSIANLLKEKNNLAFSISPFSFPLYIKKLYSINTLNLYLKGNFIYTNYKSIIDPGQYMSKRLTEIIFPECTTIGSNAFSSCTSLNQALFPECTTIGRGAFNGCTSLNQVSFPECITIEDGAFQNCTSLSQVSFPECIYLGNNVFSSCTSLRQIILPKCPTIGDGAFYGCTSLSQVSLPKCITIKWGAFQNCYNLISLYLPASSLCYLVNENVFESTPISTYSDIAGRYGSIFVPASLVNAYKIASNWSNYSTRIFAIEDYPWQDPT